MSNIETKLNELQPFSPPNATDEMLRSEDLYRRGIAKYTQRIADTKRNSEASLAVVERRLMDEFDRHNQTVNALQQEMETIKQDMGKAIAADTRLLAAVQAALDMLTNDAT